MGLDIRPIHHWLSGRMRAHVFLCVLSYYAEWHMRRALAPMLFDDENKDAGKRTEDGEPVHSFPTLIADLGTLCLGEVAVASNPNYVLTMATRATPLQQRALDLLGVSLAAARYPPSQRTQ